MNWFKRKPPIFDEALAELADMFASKSPPLDSPIPGQASLANLPLDYSVQSLVLVDNFLDQFRYQIDALDDASFAQTVLRCGAYAGEVIRRNSTRTTYHWIDQEGAAMIDREFASWEPEISLMAVLWDGGTSLVFPVAKVCKRIANSPEDSIHFFARAVIGGALREQAADLFA